MSDPRLNWEAIDTEERVIIPTADGKSIAEEITVKVPAHRDPKTGEIYLGEAALQILDDVRARHTGLLTREEIRHLRERLNRTQKQLCALLQLGEKTWTRWETGRERPSRSMNLLLSALNEGRIDIPWLIAHQHPAKKPVHVPWLVRQLAYMRSPTSYRVCAGSIEQEDTLPGLEAEIQVFFGRSAWMVATAGMHVSEGRTALPGQFVASVPYHRSPSAPPWRCPPAAPDTLAARCTQAPVVPRLDLLA